MNLVMILKILSIIQSIFDGSTYQIIKQLVGLLIKLIDILMLWLNKKGKTNEEFNESAKSVA